MEGLAPATVEAFAEYLEVNSRFHREMWRLSKSSALERALEAASALPFAGPSALVFGDAEAAVTGRMGLLALEHHRALVEAIATREGTRAEALAREHSRVSRRNLERALADRNLLDRLPGGSLIQS